MPTVTLQGLPLKTSISWTPTEDDLLGQAAEVRLRLPFPPVRFYRHGWHSWSLATWLDPAQPLPTPTQRPLWPQTDDPAYLHQSPSLWSVGLAVMEGPNSERLLLGSLGLDSRLRLEGETLIGWSEHGAVPWFLAAGEGEPPFTAYAHRLSATWDAGAKLHRRGSGALSTA